MKDYRDENYYELLEIPKYATQQELKSSYTRASRYLNAESIATYSLFLPDELQLLRNRIEEAYRVLSNPETKVKYDKFINGVTPLNTPSISYPQIHENETEETEVPTIVTSQQSVDPSDSTAVEEPLHIDQITSDVDITFETKAPIIDTPQQSVDPSDSTAVEEPLHNDQIASDDDIPFEIDENTQYTGELFKKAREIKGLTLENIADRTKISIFYLRCLENDQFEDLPAKVYVKGYLKQVAKFIGLDPESSAVGYTQRMK